MSLSRSDYRVSACRRFGGVVLFSRSGPAAAWRPAGRFPCRASALAFRDSLLASLAAIPAWGPEDFVAAPPPPPPPPAVTDAWWESLPLAD